MQATDTIYIYTDASFSKPHDVAVIGFAIFESSDQHENLHISEIKVNILQVRESNNIRAEIRGALEALKSCPSGHKVLLYTDCQTICDLPSRRKKLELTKFISQSKNQPLANADLYQEFYALYDRINPELHWIKGHSAVKTTNVQKNFSYLDKEVRKKMRSL